MALSFLKNIRSWRYKSDPISVASPLIVTIPAAMKEITVVVEPDVAGTGTLDITAKVHESPAVTLNTLTSIDIATSPKADIVDAGSYSELIFTPPASTNIVVAVVDGGAGYAYADADPDTITTTASKWGSVLAGDVVTISGSTIPANDGTYTVASATATVLTLVGTDVLTAGTLDTTGTIAIDRPSIITTTTYIVHIQAKK